LLRRKDQFNAPGNQVQRAALDQYKLDLQIRQERVRSHDDDKPDLVYHEVFADRTRTRPTVPSRLMTTEIVEFVQNLASSLNRMCQAMTSARHPFLRYAY
jgi:hypothetical protein